MVFLLLNVNNYCCDFIMMKSAHDGVRGSSVSCNLEYSYTKRGDSDGIRIPSSHVAVLQTRGMGGERHLLLTVTPVVN